MPVLDIGCGIGVQSTVLSEQGFKVVAIDLSDGMIQRARQLAETHKQNVTFIQGDARDLGSVLPNDLSFNGFVCCGSTILHFAPEHTTRLAQQLHERLAIGSRGFIEFFNWSLVGPEDLEWTPRSHIRNDNVERFSLEFFHDRPQKVVSSIVLLTRNLKQNTAWQIETQADFVYWKYSPEDISKTFEQAGFDTMEISQGDRRDPTAIAKVKTVQ